MSVCGFCPKPIKLFGEYIFILNGTIPAFGRVYKYILMAVICPDDTFYEFKPQLDYISLHNNQRFIACYKYHE